MRDPECGNDRDPDADADEADDLSRVAREIVVVALFAEGNSEGAMRGNEERAAETFDLERTRELNGEAVVDTARR